MGAGQLYQDRRDYYVGIESLSKQIETLVNSLPPSIAEFYGGFISSYKEAETMYKYGYDSFPLGIAYIGRLKRPGQRGL